jgi:hypothetical protein
MTNITLPEVILIVGLAYVFWGRPLININSGWQWFKEEKRKEKE